MLEELEKLVKTGNSRSMQAYLYENPEVLKEEADSQFSVTKQAIDMRKDNLALAIIANAKRQGHSVPTEIILLTRNNNSKTPLIFTDELTSTTNVECSRRNATTGDALVPGKSEKEVNRQLKGKISCALM